MSRYFVDEGISTYTHVSDHLSTYGTKVIVVTQPEATFVLDEILGNQTDLPIAEHATDTAGASLVNFGLFDLVGKTFSPRIRDLGVLGDPGGRFPVDASAWPHLEACLGCRCFHRRSETGRISMRIDVGLAPTEDA